MITPTPLAALVIYNVNPASLRSSFDRDRIALHSELDRHGGIRSTYSFQSVEQDYQFVDYSLWRATELVQNTGIEMATSQLRSSYTKAFDYVHFAGLFQLDREPAEPTFSGQGILQLAIVRLKPSRLGAAEAKRATLLAGIERDLDLCLALHSGQSVNDPAICFDALKWGDLEAQQWGAKVIHQMEACPAFMTTIEQDIYFQSLRRYA